MNPLPPPIRSGLESLLALLFPEVCQLCGEERGEAASGYLCTPCRSRLPRIAPPMCDRCGLPYPGDITGPFDCLNCRDLDLAFTQARSLLAAKGTGLELVHRYKYHRAFWFEPLFESLFREKAAPGIDPAAWDLIVPVPLHPVKHREREFNQAEHLARLLGRATGIPVDATLLRRAEHTATQTTLTRRARSRNVHGAFTLARSLPADSTRLILVDDVLTTGATTSACARVLRDAGATQIIVWTLARGL
ncbi:MAG TPA: hypothetical protein DCM86_12585 [Verrucomicrobiales bacterium]|nr:hypothetical protein [Verrucomicrobiales bacterium]